MREHDASQPIFNIKAVTERTGIPPVTLRAWERRYSFPEPRRTENGYRLYSEEDVAALKWLKMQTDSGLAIGRAIKLLKTLRVDGQYPVTSAYQAGSGQPASTLPSIEKLNEQLLDRMVALDEAGSGEILRSALSMLPLETVMLDMIEPVMVEIGERWHSSEISVTTEHFATALCKLYLLHALESLHTHDRRGVIVAACAPKEWHELGLIILTILLRMRDWTVLYLGPHISLDRLGETVARLEPKMLLFSATGVQAAEQLSALNHVLTDIPDPKPLIGLGGQAFVQDPTLANRIPGTIITGRADDAVSQISRLLKQT
jgi:DNA-binding transcriptional MerR regulator